MGDKSSHDELMESTLSIDHREIDRDHQRLFVLAERISVAAVISAPVKGVMISTNDFMEFVAIHFGREEFLMNPLHYPDAGRHQAAHGAWHDRLCAMSRNSAVAKVRSAHWTPICKFTPTALSNSTTAPLRRGAPGEPGRPPDGEMQDYRSLW